jgi:hypothetical protein
VQQDLLAQQDLQDLLVPQAQFRDQRDQLVLPVPDLTYLAHTQLFQRFKLRTQQALLVMHILLQAVYMFGMVLHGHLVETFKDQQAVPVQRDQQVQQE